MSFFGNLTTWTFEHENAPPLFNAPALHRVVGTHFFYGTVVMVGTSTWKARGGGVLHESGGVPMQARVTTVDYTRGTR